MSLDAKKTTNYQELTNRILRSGSGLTNPANDYGNPIRAIEMQGHFFRRLKSTKKYRVLSIFFAFIFFILPATFGILFFLQIVDWSDPTQVLPIVILLAISSIGLMAGIKLLISTRSAK